MLRASTWSVVCCVGLLAGCHSSRGPDREADGGVTAVDSGTPDAGSPDAGHDGGAPADAGDLGMCNPEMGIECDGDWDGRCTPACAADECCSPFMGRFACAPRDADGKCPAADIWVDPERLMSSVSFEWRNFPADDCAIVEGCVEASGERRLLLFDTWTPNTGNADLYLGPPSASVDYFQYSSCHMHYHFNSYAQYGLYDESGLLAAMGHKQAFCLLDFYQYPGTSGRGAHYTCSNQGIEANWQDVYGSNLDCQWVDITDVEPGTYTLRVDLNFEHLLNESDYSNNQTEVTITIPPEASDVTVPCGGAARGAGRDCGLTHEGDHTCTAGATVEVGCAAACSLGSCTGDSVIRVCETSVGLGCTQRYALGSNDDHDCGGPACGGGGGAGCCSDTSFTCPASGEYSVFHGPYDAGAAYTCTIATSP